MAMNICSNIQISEHYYSNKIFGVAKGNKKLNVKKQIPK